MMDKTNDPFDVWNDEQVFGGQELAKAYGHCAMLQLDIACLKTMESKEKKEFFVLKQDSKNIINIFFKLNALMKI